MYPTYRLSYAALNASLALVAEALSGSGESDQSAGQLVGRTRLALRDELLCPPNPSLVIWLRSTAPAAEQSLPVRWRFANRLTLRGSGAKSFRQSGDTVLDLCNLNVSFIRSKEDSGAFLSHQAAGFIGQQSVNCSYNRVTLFILRFEPVNVASIRYAMCISPLEMRISCSAISPGNPSRTRRKG
jgi:hypothetical protein